MMKNKIYGILMAAAILSVATAGIGKANAFFTANDTAAGYNSISLGDETTVDEDYDYTNKQKILVFKNSADSKNAVFVRARAYAPSTMKTSYIGEGWQEESDGWCYFTEEVKPNDEQTLKIQIGDYPLEEDKEFNVIVVYETIPAADENPLEADWDQASDEWQKI